MKTKNDNKYLNNFMRGFIGLFTYLVLNFGIGKILTLCGVNVEELTRKQALFVSFGVSFTVIVVLILLFHKTLGKNIKDYKKNWKEYFKRNIKYWVCSLAFMYVFNFIIAIIFNRLTSANDATIRELFDVLPLYIVIEATIIAPITEELVFRQSIRSMINNKWVFIILSGLIFGFMHTIASLKDVADFLYIIPYSIPGCFFAYMLYEEDNVLVPMTFHVIHNSMAIILLIISKLAGIV